MSLTDFDHPARLQEMSCTAHVRWTRKQTCEIAKQISALREFRYLDFEITHNISFLRKIHWAQGV